MAIMHQEARAIRFVVLDDDAFMRKLVTRSLGALGYADVVDCAGGVEALAAVSRSAVPSEVVVCDLNMPGMDGIEFLRALAGISYGGGVIVLSGEDQRILQSALSLAKAHRLSVLGYLEKPVRGERLAALLAGWQPRTPAGVPAASRRCAPDDIRRGLAAGEFIAYFQPKVELATGRVSGVEALARWQHPERGLVPPDSFISVAEEHGLIGLLTQSIVSASLRQSSAWRARGLKLHLAINVSMDDLVQLDFPDRLLVEAEAAGIPPFDISLEVTESRFMRDPVSPLDILSRLRLKRVGLSIDDFGTGYSGLVQLQGIPFTELKIDRQFVQGAGRDPTARAILESSVELAKKLNMQVVAEGVETRGEWDRVVALGCDLAQGYFIARPMPGDALPGWIDTWSAP